LRRALAALCLLASACATSEQANGRPWVHRLSLAGVKSVSASDLREKIALQETGSGWWLPLATRRYLDPFTLLADQARIEAYYHAHGFFGARVLGARVTPYRPGAVDVAVTVDEGAPTKIRSVGVRGLPALAPGESLGHLHLHRGNRFDHELYLGQKQALVDHLKQLGFAWAAVDGEVRVDRDAGSADIRLTARPGVRARFGDVTVRGAQHLDTGELTVHAGVPSGERFDPAALDEARGRLESLRLFSQVLVTVAPHPGDRERADVAIALEEAPRHQVELGGGIGVEPQRYDGHLQLTHTTRGVAGSLATLRLKLEAGYVAFPPSLVEFYNVQQHGPVAGAEARLARPDLPFRLGQVSATVGFDLGIEYAYQYYGPRTQLGWTQSLWHDRVKTGLSFNWQLLEFFSTVTALGQVALSDPATAGRLFGYVSPYRLGWWQEDVALDLRDRPLEARRGVYLALSAEEGGDFAGGAFAYEKLLPEARVYFPLWRGGTLALRGQYGRMFGQGELGTPITRRFYLGGSASHRGFGYNRLSQQVWSCPAGAPPTVGCGGNAALPGVPIGGDEMLLVQAELRAQVASFGGGAGLGLVAFLDGGDVAAPSCGASAAQCTLPASAAQTAVLSVASRSVQVGNLHWAAGGGLRIHIGDFGTLRLDVGVRLNRTDPPNPDPAFHWYDRVAAHVSFGEAF
jgi:translocation and assembly module TamA